MQAALTRSNELLNEHNQGPTPKPIKLLLTEAIRSSNPCTVPELKVVCQKHTEDKTLADCLLILRHMEEFASFRENRRDITKLFTRKSLILDDQEYLILALSLRYREYKPWEALCRIGDAPSEIYYVLEGKIAVTSVNAVTYTEEALQDKIFHNEGAGATLGEASILYNSNRTASLVAATPAAIVFMLKEPYMRTIGDLVRKAHLYRIEMIQKQDIFSKWTMAQLASLYRNFEKKELAYGVMIYKAGDKNDMIYVILKGEVEILAKPQTEAIKQGLFINRNVEKKPAVVIKKIGDSCYFGNEEGFDQEEKVYTAKVSSYSCSLIQISKKKIRQNTQYEPELMAFIYSQSNKKKVFFEKEKVNVFERNKQMFGKKNNQVMHLNPKEVLTGRESHFRSTSNLEEGSVYTQPEPAGTSPGLRMKNYAENLLKAAELYKDPGSLDSAVFEAPKRSWKNQSKLNRSGSDQTKSIQPQQIPTETSTQTMFLPNNRELLHGTQQPSLIENIQKMQKEQNKYPHIVFDGKSQMSSEWSQISPNPGRNASKSNRNHVGSSMSQEDTFEAQSAWVWIFILQIRFLDVYQPELSIS